jgi:hypothetical protein
VSLARSRTNIGEERYIVSMFVDMRGSTAASQAALEAGADA